jgi:hypothetical protein
VPREVPGGDVGAFLSARFKGSDGPDAWPCRGVVLLDRPVAEVVPFAGDAVVEAVTRTRSRLHIGSWSWIAPAAALARFDAEIQVVEPPELREAFTALAGRAERAARAAEW